MLESGKAIFSTVHSKGHNMHLVICREGGICSSKRIPRKKNRHLSGSKSKNIHLVADIKNRHNLAKLSPKARLYTW